jgi:hypothetical protein
LSAPYRGPFLEGTRLGQKLYLAPNWAKNSVVAKEKPLPWSDASLWRQGIGIRSRRLMPVHSKSSMTTVAVHF